MTVRSLILGFALLCLGVASGWAAHDVLKDAGTHVRLGTNTGTGSLGVTLTPKETSEKIQTVWNLLTTRYIDPSLLQDQSLLEGALRGLVDAVGDPYTTYLSKRENEEFSQDLSGHLQGIGAELTMTGGLVVVASPLKGSPAERMGIQSGDVIAEVDHVNILGKSLIDVVLLIRGPKGTHVVLTIKRVGQAAPLTFDVVRDDILIPSVEYSERSVRGNLIGIIALNKFGAETSSEMTRILHSTPSNLHGLIIDLRGNGGGYLNGAVEIASMFLPSGRVVGVRGRTDLPDHYDATGEVIAPTIPLVVLINKGSASASEILAGALQDHGRARIVGVQSFGKGTVQEIIDLDDGSSLKITTAHWLTPNGKDLGKEGVTPDVIVLPGKDPKVDVQMERAVEEVGKIGG